MSEEAATFAKMKFEAFSSADFDKEHDLGLSYEVKINPESFDRTLSVTAPSGSQMAGSVGDPSDNAVVGKESYSFDLIFDGTGVINGMVGPEAVQEDFQNFLDVVYCHKEDNSKNQGAANEDGIVEDAPGEVKLANYVKLTYCKHSFCVLLESMTVKYLLMHRSGLPLRIKASCRFSTAQKVPKDASTEDKAAPAPKPKKNSVKKTTPSKECVCVCPQYEETVSTAQSNDSVSLMACDYSKEEMSEPNYTPVQQERNYTPVDGGR